MASAFHLFLFLSLLFFVSASAATPKTFFRPRALVLPVTKDASTLQYYIQLNQRTPLTPVKLTVDLGGRFLWQDCEQGYVSSSYRPVPCDSSACKVTKSRMCTKSCFRSPIPIPGCSNNTCSHMPDNLVIGESSDGELAEDVVSVQSTDGSKPGPIVTVPRFLFVCGSTNLLRGLANGVMGMAGFGRTLVSVPSLFAASFKFDRKFAICLGYKGVIFFGNEPYVMQPNKDVSKNLMYTPLLLNPVSTSGSYFTGDPSADYFIGVQSIKITDVVVPINASLLSIEKKEGYGGTKISTIVPYTTLETSIYNALVRTFIKQLSGIPQKPTVAPFGTCFDAKRIGSTRVGPGVPQIELVLQNQTVWTIFGANSMVRVSHDVLCLGFVDGGVRPRTSIVIGAHQLEGNLLQFDLANKRLGFSSSLLFRQTTCSNFDFRSKA